jgi:hypothetical protein
MSDLDFHPTAGIIGEADSLQSMTRANARVIDRIDPLATFTIMR